MFVYQNGKLYIQDGDDLVGVEIYPNKVVKVKGTETKLADKYQFGSLYEMRCRFNVTEEKPYIFPVETVNLEVEKDDTVRTAKVTTRKYTRK